MNIPPAGIFAPMQRNVQAESHTGSPPAGTGAFMTVLADVQDRGAADATQTEGALSLAWVPWTEEELSKLERDGAPEWEVQNLREQTFPEVAAERWMRIIAPFLNEASLPDAKTDYITAGRAKCPFLDWVLSGKDPVEFFRQQGKLAMPLHQVTDGVSPIMITSAAPVTQPAVPSHSVASTDAGIRAAAQFTQSPLAPISTEPASDRQPVPHMEKPQPAASATGDDPAQGAPQDVGTHGADPGDADTRVAVPPARVTDSHNSPIALRSAESAQVPPAGAAVLVAREAVETARPQLGQASRPVLATSTVLVQTELPQTDAVARPPVTTALMHGPDLFLSELAERMQVQLRGGGRDIRIQLTPANLGHLEIMAQTGNEGVVARIVTESSAVKEYLENHLHVLEQALSDQGLRMDRIDVVAQSYLETGQSNSQPEGQYRGSGRRSDSGQGDGAASAVSTVTAEGGLTELSLGQPIGPNSTFHTVA